MNDNQNSPKRECKVKLVIKQENLNQKSNSKEKSLNTKSSNLTKVKSPLRRISSNINLSNITPKTKSKTSLDINERNKIRETSIKLLDLSEIFSDILYKNIDQNDSEADSDFSDGSDVNNLIEEKSKSKNFNDILNKYYVPSSQNVSGNYDFYIGNCLKVISYMKPHSYFNSAINTIKNSLPSFSYDENKLLMLIDLDETMICSDLELKWAYYDTYVSTKDSTPIPLNLRPYLYDFLDESIKYFDIIVYTASCSEYADPILNYIEKDKLYFKGRLYREHCIKNDNFFIKDLSLFNKPIEKTIIIDNNLFSFPHYLSNGILVTSYYNENDDMDLLCLLEFFKSLYNSNDVRDIIEENFNFNCILREMKQKRDAHKNRKKIDKS